MISVTAEPYFPPMGYLTILPMAPASLYKVAGNTGDIYLEGVLYQPRPTGVLIRVSRPETSG